MKTDTEHDIREAFLNDLLRVILESGYFDLQERTDGTHYAVVDTYPELNKEQFDHLEAMFPADD